MEEGQEEERKERCRIAGRRARLKSGGDEGKNVVFCFVLF